MNPKQKPPKYTFNLSGVELCMAIADYLGKTGRLPRHVKYAFRLQINARTNDATLTADPQPDAPHGIVVGDY